MKRPKATLKPFLNHTQPHGSGLWNFYIGELESGQCLTYDTARHLAACWNACRDIETDELETRALVGILVEKGLVESPERAFLKKLHARLYPSILEDNWQTRLDRDLEKELERLLEK